MIRSFVGLAMGAVATAVVAAVLVPGDMAWGAPSVDVAAFRAVQPATQTATPRIRLRGTPTPLPRGATATATVAVPPTAGGVTEGATPAATADAAGEGPSPGGKPGSEGPVPAGPGVPTPVEIASPALPGGEGAPSGGAGEGGGAGEAAGGLPPDGPGGLPSVDGPRGLIPVPVDDRVVMNMWSRFGSPRQDQGLTERLTTGRPGLWGWWPFYLVLTALFGYWVGRLWKVIGDMDRDP